MKSQFKPQLNDLLASSWAAAAAGALAAHVGIAIALAISSVGHPVALGELFGIVLLSSMWLPITLMGYLIIGSLIGPLTYKIMARIGLVTRTHAVVVGGLLGSVAGLMLFPLAGVPVLGVATAFAGWTFHRVLFSSDRNAPEARASSKP